MNNENEINFDAIRTMMDLSEILWNTPTNDTEVYDPWTGKMIPRTADGIGDMEPYKRALMAFAEDLGTWGNYPDGECSDCVIYESEHYEVFTYYESEFDGWYVGLIRRKPESEDLTRQNASSLDNELITPF